MNATVVYEIAHYKGHKPDAALLERLQLIAEDGALRLRDADGNETQCKETDVASAISSTPALRKVAKRQQARITCGEDILGKLPFLLEPIPEDASLLVNGEAWDAFPTVDSDTPGSTDGHRPPRRPTDVMLPGYCDYECAPEMNPCWAEYRCAEGGRDFENQLGGSSSIGLLTPGIAIEHGRTDYGGNGGVAAVSITPFDDFAATFINWLLSTPIISSFWNGYLEITSPGVDLFAEAAATPNHEGYWEHDENTDEHDEWDEDDDSGDEDGDREDEGFACRSLKLHLPQELIDEVRARLIGMDPKYAAVLGPQR